MREPAVQHARELLRQSISEGRVFPAAAVEVGSGLGPIWRETFGSLSFDDDARAADEDTIFDLASLTKPIATTSVVMSLLADGRLALGDPVSLFFPEWRGADRGAVTVQDLLEHASGLPARLVDSAPAGRREFEHDICASPLECTPRSASLYSDLGFILLGFLAADRGTAGLDVLFERLEAAIRQQCRGRSPDLALSFTLPPAERARAAVTLPLAEDHRHGRVLAGEVHDNYAAALGGVAGHAGLFGTAAGVGCFARAVLRGARGEANAPHPFTGSLVARMVRQSSVPGSSRALGWDTMLPTSSCGTRMSARAFGHVGFTGTSLWIDPVRDRYFVLLTNRAGGGGTVEQMGEVRRSFHDIAADV
jgi:CubicO group peptidase (beta-lactamase class C family)